MIPYVDVWGPMYSYLWQGSSNTLICLWQSRIVSSPLWRCGLWLWMHCSQNVIVEMNLNTDDWTQIHTYHAHTDTHTHILYFTIWLLSCSVHSCTSASSLVTLFPQICWSQQSTLQLQIWSRDWMQILKVLRCIVFQYHWLCLRKLTQRNPVHPTDSHTVCALIPVTRKRSALVNVRLPTLSVT